MPDLRLRPMTGADEHAALRADAELASSGFRFLQAHDAAEPWAEYVDRVTGWRRGLHLASAAVILHLDGIEGETYADHRGVKRRFWIVPGADELWLRPLTDDDEKVALRAHEELADDDFPFILDRDRADAWPDYVAMLGR